MENTSQIDPIDFESAREYQEELLRLVASLVENYARQGKRLRPWIQNRLGLISSSNFYKTKNNLLHAPDLVMLEDCIENPEVAFSGHFAFTMPMLSTIPGSDLFSLEENKKEAMIFSSRLWKIVNTKIR